mmetsp:Transcript_47398/g.57396  ORF Transcript_47398/g.57396 Transcript_47398/m.57396 type:complete len:117 (-) Transcript_47398:192-542(-)
MINETMLKTYQSSIALSLPNSNTCEMYICIGKYNSEEIYHPKLRIRAGCRVYKFREGKARDEERKSIRQLTSAESESEPISELEAEIPGLPSRQSFEIVPLKDNLYSFKICPSIEY